jgi:hypothetical protein
MNQLPEITVSCKNKHEFTTRAHGGQGIDCPLCKAAGQRVKVWISKQRPRTARELADRQGAEAAESAARPGSELAARWKREPPWDGRQLADWPGRPSDLCLRCGGPLTWEPGRTWTNCDACSEGEGGVALPAAVTAHYERQAEIAIRASAEVAIRADPAAEQAARVRLRALQDGARQRVESWLETIADPDSYDRVQNQGQARQLAAMLTAWLPEINTAVDEPALAATWVQIEALITGDQGRALSGEYEQAQFRVRQRYEARQYEIQDEQQQEREQREAERAERQAEREQARQPKAITGGGAAYRADIITALAPVAIMIEQRKQARDQQIAAKGECGFKHSLAWTRVVASRLYFVPARDWQGNDTGQRIADTPQYRVCPKHYMAVQAQLNREGFSDIVYLEL